MTDLSKVFQKYAGKEVAMKSNLSVNGFKKSTIMTPDLNDVLLQEIFKIAAKNDIYINIVYPVPTKRMNPSTHTRQVNMHLHLEKDEKGKWPTQGAFKIIGFTQS